jgi:4-alpha-glucanotransferase
VVYTGTHDNDTTRGAFATLDEESQARWRDYLGPTLDGEAWDPTLALVRAAYTSVARWAVVPAQDLFGLDSRARMNVPGAPSDNWTWRARAQDFDAPLARRLRRLAEISGRWTERTEVPGQAGD